MPYRYEMIILEKKTHRFWEIPEVADSFVEAISRIFLREREFSGKILSIYCRKPVSSDLQLMAEYDGFSSFSTGSEFFSHILRLSNGLQYHLTDEGFVRMI